MSWSNCVSVISDAGPECVVYVFNNNGEVRHHFLVKGNEKWDNSLSILVNSKGKVFIVYYTFMKASCVLDVYVNDGQFLRRFGEGQLRSVTDLTLATDDRVIVLHESCYVHIFSEHGDHRLMYARPL